MILILSGWAKADAAIEENGNNKKFKLSVKVIYADGTSEWKKPAEFNSTVSEWQFASNAFTLKDSKDAKKTPVRIEIHARYDYQINTAYFDKIQLIKDVAQSYTYETIKENSFPHRKTQNKKQVWNITMQILQRRLTPKVLPILMTINTI